jgi:hypothetical protein
MQHDFETEYFLMGQKYIQEALSKLPDNNDPPLLFTVQMTLDDLKNNQPENIDPTAELMHASII